MSSNLTAPTISFPKFFIHGFEHEKELASLSGFAADSDASAVGDNNFPRNGQTQADTGFGLSGNTVETIKDAALEFFRNA
ncbi:MAG TPA: hypothetical protein VFZ59_17875 [Verrucomicrobiae bacterium]|nr:hypothetical protein [Verrucomicrobiae bacterium]